MGSGSSFNDQTNPKVVVQVGASGSSGTVEITDILFKTKGPGLYFFRYIGDSNSTSWNLAAGAIVVEWNVQQGAQGTAGMWDSHIIIVSYHLSRTDAILNIF